MLVSDDALILSVDTQSGRTRQQRIHASNIIRIKYREQGTNPLPTVATGALEGAISGGYIPLQTGNLGLDLLTGALQGAIGGLFQGSSFSRKIYVDQRTDYFRNFVYPQLIAGR